MGSKKWGTGHFGAMGRLGLAELRASMYAGSNVAQQPVYGLYGTKTPGEVADDRRDIHGNSGKKKQEKKKDDKSEDQQKDQEKDQEQNTNQAKDGEPKKDSIIEDRLRQAEMSVEKDQTKNMERERETE